MKYSSKPNVYLVSRPSVDWEQIAAFLSDEDLPPIPASIRAGADDANAIIETSARLCYMSFGRGRRDIEDFIYNLLSSKDGSVFEHVNYGFVITGVSRSLTHELVRHRAGFAYSQRSQRYVDETEGSFVLPPALVMENGAADDARAILEDALESAADSYVKLVKELEEVLPRRAVQPQHRPAQGAIETGCAGESFALGTPPRPRSATSSLTGGRQRPGLVGFPHFIEMSARRVFRSIDWEIRSSIALQILELRIFRRKPP